MGSVSAATPAWVATAYQIVVRALGWLEAAREHFALALDCSCDRLDPVKDFKPVGELALAASIVIREGVTGTREAQLAPALAAFAWAQLREGALLYELARTQPVDTCALEIYACFAEAGYRHRRLDELLTHLGRLRAARVLEMIPSRALAVIHAERRLGLTPRQDPAVLIERTWLGGTPEPWAVDFSTLYAMTHTVFALTDFGARPDDLPASVQTYLHAWLPAWIEVYLEAGQWDLLAELVTVDLCLTKPASYPPVWDALARAQQPDGLLPMGPQRVPTTLAKAFRGHHHPTLVAVIAGTLAISRHSHVRVPR